MGNNMISYPIAIGENFLYDHFHFIKNKKIDEGTLLSSTNGSFDPYDYHVSNCAKKSFMKIEKQKIQSYYAIDDNDDDDSSEENSGGENEEESCDGSNEIVRISNQKCVICLEQPSVYAFRESGHQCLCQNSKNSLGLKQKTFFQ